MTEPKMVLTNSEPFQQRKEHFSSVLWSEVRAIASITIVLVIATGIECSVFIERHDGPGRWMAPFLYGGLLWFWWAGFAFLLCALGRRWPTLWHVSWINVVLQLFTGILLALGHLMVLHIAIQRMIEHWPHLAKVGYAKLAEIGFERLSQEVLLYVVAWIGCSAIYTQIARQKEAVQSAELKEQLSKAHLHALQMQLEPHFLLNTLNAITALVEDGSKQQAAEILFHLNAILKSTLVRQAPEKVCLAAEIAVIEHYLAIEQIRFADRLCIEMSVDPRALDSMIPCFLLQPIIENAVRYGVASLKAGGVICTSVEREGNMLHLSVRDNGPGSKNKATPGHGIGLRNTEDRLALFYPKNYQFRSGDAEPIGFEVSITIPYERAMA